MRRRKADADGDGSRRTLDLRGLRCPLPALKTRRALLACAPGATLVVVTDDPLAFVDIPDVARRTGGQLIEAEHHGAVARFVVTRAPQPS